jgi:hypothetical protein
MTSSEKIVPAQDDAGGMVKSFRRWELNHARNLAAVQTQCPSGVILDQIGGSVPCPLFP